MHYTIHPNPDADATETVSAGDIVARVDELSGRNIGRYIVTNAIPATRRRSGRASAYVATNGGSPGRALYGRGFIVKQHWPMCDLPHRAQLDSYASGV